MAIPDETILRQCHKVTLAHEAKDEKLISETEDDLKTLLVNNQEYDLLQIDKPSCIFWYECNKHLIGL